MQTTIREGKLIVFLALGNPKPIQDQLDWLRLLCFRGFFRGCQLGRFCTSYCLLQKACNQKKGLYFSWIIMIFSVSSLTFAMRLAETQISFLSFVVSKFTKQNGLISKCKSHFLVWTISRSGAPLWINHWVLHIPDYLPIYTVLVVV